MNSIGTVSFGAPFTTIPQAPLPLPQSDDSTLVAPFWNLITQYRGGNVFFRFSEDEDLMEEVGMRIEAAFREEFHPELVFVATWDQVTRFSISIARVS